MSALITIKKKKEQLCAGAPVCYCPTIPGAAAVPVAPFIPQSAAPAGQSRPLRARCPGNRWAPGPLLGPCVGRALTPDVVEPVQPLG